jgi:hypothetical protein
VAWLLIGSYGIVRGIKRRHAPHEPL